MNLPWDKYEYSDPFLVQTTYWEAKYFMWRRNLRTGQYKLKSTGITTCVSATGQNHKAPNPIEILPPMVKS
jgi:hypothetical protein